MMKRAIQATFVGVLSCSVGFTPGIPDEHAVVIRADNDGLLLANVNRVSSDTRRSFRID
jgi:hypothetical protein